MYLILLENPCCTGWNSPKNCLPKGRPQGRVGGSRPFWSDCDKDVVVFCRRKTLKYGQTPPMFEVDAGRHSFTTPVMGIAFTIDSPLKLARYGISSTVSLVDDLFLEQMRKHHSARCGDDYVPIAKNAPNGRALRVTAYLDFLDRQVALQMKEIRSLPFEEGSDICRYFELLPESPLRTRYQEMLDCSDESEK